MSAIYNPWQQRSQLDHIKTNQSTEANSQSRDLPKIDSNQSLLSSNIALSQSQATTGNYSQSHAVIEIPVCQPQLAKVTTVNPHEVQEGQKFTVHKPIFFPVYKYF